MMRKGCLIAAAATLVACGGGGDGPNFWPSPPPDKDAGGSLIDAPVVQVRLTRAQIDAATAANGLNRLSGPAACDVDVVPLNYRTRGVNDELTNASGVLLLPAGDCAKQNAPLVGYAHGTDVRKPATMANPQGAETQLLVAMLAAQGYAVAATDYLGYAKSAYPFHPYLHADSQALSVLDALRAGRAAAKKLGAGLSGKVLLTGYSQGGHASMAAHRAAERDHAEEFDLVAGAHSAGPYNLSGSAQSPVAIAGVQFFVTFLITAYQKTYGGIYNREDEVFRPPYAAGISDLLPSPTLTTETLVTTGKLPGLTEKTPQAVSDALFQPAFLTQIQTNPDHPLVLRAKQNDMFGWSPRAATLLCGGAGDPTVPVALHMQPMLADFAARGVTTVRSVDVDPQIQATYGPGGAAPTDPASPAFATYYASYHGQYEPPLCLFAARQSFNLALGRAL